MKNDSRGLARQLGRIWTLLIKYFGKEYLYQQTAIKITGTKRDYWFLIRHDEHIETSLVFVYSAKEDVDFDDVYMERYITSFRLGRNNCANLGELIEIDMEHLVNDAATFVHEIFSDLMYILRRLPSYKKYHEYASNFSIPYDKTNRAYLKITFYHFF